MSKKINLLTFYERQRIEYYLRLKMGRRTIAKRLKRDHSVIVREIKRNQDKDGIYQARLAQQKADQRAKQTNKRKLDTDMVLQRWVEAKLKAGWSPEQVAGRLKSQPPTKLKGRTISHESIYDYIYEAQGKHWYHYLRRARKQRQPHYKRKKQTKTVIKERISIHERSEVIDERLRYGDWESDSIEFSQQKPRVSVQYERKAMLARLHKLANGTAQETHQALNQSLDSLPEELLKSITFDNGPENVCHRDIRDKFKIETYFCDTYASWQKGGVENLNGLIRQYLPRKTKLDTLTDEDIESIQELLNNRPRKKLNYLTPNEVVNKILPKGGALNS
jgi:transposase, IS30 family